MGNKPIIEVQNLSVNYGELNVLNGVNLNIYQNDFLGIIGPNGGGKTTLIKAIIGAVDYEGSITYNIDGGDDKMQNIGYLPQISNFDKGFPISVKEVVLSGLQSKRKFGTFYSKQDKIKAIDLLQLIGIEFIADKPIGEISGGQLQRTLLCRAMISDPKVLILDEPANFVDNKFEKELYELLKMLNEKVAIVMVSHDLGTITSVVKSIVCVNRNVHRHNSNVITSEQLSNYNCPMQLISHGEIPHTILKHH